MATIRMTRFLPVLLVAITVLGFYSVLNCDFTNWDDSYTVAENAGLNPPRLSAMVHYWRHADMDIYMPLTQSIWYAVAELTWRPASGAGDLPLRPGVFHAVNLAVHITVVLLVYSLIQLLVPNQFAAFFGAAIFAIHPLQVEAVAWISGLKDVLCGMLSLAALRCWLAPVNRVDRPRLRQLMAFILFAAALFAKPSAVTLPLVAGVLAVVGLGWPVRRALVRLVPWIVVAIIFGIVAARSQPGAGAARVPLYDRPLIAADALTFYLHKIVWPTNLGIDYGRAPEVVLARGRTILIVELTGLVALGVGIAGCWRRFPVYVAGIVIFVVAILPVLGLVRFDFQQYSTVADHYVYVAMIGVSLIVSSLLGNFSNRVVYGIAVIVTVVYTITAHHQAGYWKNAVALMTHGIAVNPGSWVCQMNLGVALTPISAPKAVGHLEIACRLRPNFPGAFDSLGMAWLADGAPERAVEAFRRAAQLSMAGPDASLHLAKVLDQLGRRDEAIAAYEHALQIQPNQPTVLSDLAAVLAESGHRRAAIALYRRALQLDPDLMAAREGLALAMASSTTQTDEQHANP